MKLENQDYSKTLHIYWFLLEVVSYPAKSGLKKTFISGFLHDSKELFETIWNYLSNLFAQYRGKSDPNVTCWTHVKVGEIGNLRPENGLFVFWLSVKVARTCHWTRTLQMSTAGFLKDYKEKIIKVLL